MKKTFFFIFLILLILPVNAFEDNLQDHPSDDAELGDETNIWDFIFTYSSSESIVQYSETYNKALYVRSYRSGAGGAQAWFGNYYPAPSSYYSFVVRDYLLGDAGFNSLIYLYDRDGSQLLAYSVKSYFDACDDDDFYEIVVSSGNAYLYINGSVVANMGAVTDTPYYFHVRLAEGREAPLYHYIYTDSWSDDGFLVGVGTDESPNTWINVNSNNEIDVEWTVNTIDPVYDWDAYTYVMKVKHLNTGEIVNSTTVNKTKPAGFVIYNRSTLMPAPDYGVYKFYLEKNGQEVANDYLAFIPVGEGATLSYDKSNYVPYETAIASYTLSGEDFSSYNYYIKTFNDDFELQNTTQITSSSGTVNYYLEYDSDTYIAFISKVSKSDSSEYYMGYDTFDIDDEVRLSGYTYNATDNSVLSSVLVNDSQSDNWYNTSSNTTGFYELDGLSDSLTTYVRGTLTNYTHENFSFTPLVAGYYEVDMYLFPTNRTITTGLGMLEGMTVDYPLHQGIETCNVYISNATWSNSTISTSWGYYNFTNLSPGNYDVYASKTGYDNSTSYSVTITANTSTVQNLVLTQQYNLTVRARDSTTGAYISSFVAIVGSQSYETTNGYAYFDLDYGLYTVSVSADNYYAGTGNVLMNQNRTTIISLIQTESPYYAPTYVKFIVQSFWGTRYEDVTVTAYLYGETEETVSGITGDDGAVSFNRTSLLESNKYTITFISTAQGISETRDLYPVDDLYYVIVSTTRTDWDYYDLPISDAIDFDITTEEINSTHAYINVSYNDSIAGTTGLLVYVNQSNSSDPANQTLIDSWNAGAISSGTHSFIVTPYQGQSYYVRVMITHNTYGNIDTTYTISFPGEWYSKFDGVPSFVWVYGSIFMLLFVGAVFVASNVEKGMLVVSIMAAMFSGFGMWESLPDPIETNMNIGIVLAFFISIAALIVKHQKGEGYS